MTTCFYVHALTIEYFYLRTGVPELQEAFNRLASKLRDMSDDHQMPIELPGRTKQNDPLRRNPRVL